MRSSTLIAALIALALVGWLASPYLGFGNGAEQADEPKPAAAEPAETAAPRLSVRATTSIAEPVAVEIVLNGHTAVEREVELRAEVSGRVTEILVEEGETVETGTTILRLDERDRRAAVAEAEAYFKQRRIQNEAARKLGDRGFQAETRVAEAAAQLAEARARLERARIALEHTEIKAPFAGVLEERIAEEGDFLDVANIAARLVDLDPVLVVTDVPENDILAVRPGLPALVRLIDGSVHEGVVRYVARAADNLTRTFRAEIAVPNPQGAIPAGISATVALQLETVSAHRISPGLLSLADDGRIGVKTLDEEDIVHFVEAEVVKSAADAVWLAGLPEEVRLITVGQGFAREGQQVVVLADEPREGEDAANGDAAS